MKWFSVRRLRLIRDGRGFTRLEFGLLTAMLCAMVVNGIATLGGGLGSATKLMGPAAAAEDVRTVAELPPGPAHTLRR